MSIILVHIGKNLPDYFEYCVKQIRRYFSGDVYISCSSECLYDKDYREYNLIHLPIERYLNSTRMEEYNRTFMNKEEDFWNFTFKRLFVIEEIVKERNLNNVIHIENDNLIYTDPSTIDFSIYKDKVAVNPVGPKYGAYSYIFIPNNSSIKDLNDSNISTLMEGRDVLSKRYDEGGFVTEMLIAGELLYRKIVDALPTLPEGEGSDNIGHFNSLFDGSCHGQYIFGIPSKPEPGWMEMKRYVGEAFIFKKYDVIWMPNKNGHKEPHIVDNNNGMWKLNNLHVHSKQLWKGM